MSRYREEMLCRTAFVRTVILQNQHFNKIYPRNPKLINGNSKVYVIFGLLLQALHLNYLNVLYAILKGIARTTFVRNILPKFIILMRKSRKTSFGGTFTPVPPGGCLQGLLTCFPTLSCNMECCEQLGQVSDRLLKMQG